MNSTTLRVSTATRDKVNLMRAGASTDELLAEALEALERERTRRQLREQSAAVRDKPVDQQEAERMRADLDYLREG